MALVFGYPRAAFDLFDSYDPFFDRYAYDPFLPLVPSRKASKVNVKENKDSKGWTVKVYLPGIRYQENIKMHYKSDTLKIVADDGYHKYAEVIALPSGVVDLDRISAQFENQVLTVSIPKLETKPEKEIQIVKTEAQQREEEEAKKKEEEAKRLQEENKKKMELFYKRLSGPKVTFSETETHNALNLDFGEGVNKDNINIEILGKVLTVTVNIQEEEFKYSYQKSVSLPDNVTADQVSAAFEGNTLVVTFPKEEPKKSFKVMIADSNPTPASETQKIEISSAPETTAAPPSDENKEESKTSEAPANELNVEDKSKVELGDFVEITEGETN